MTSTSAGIRWRAFASLVATMASLAGPLPARAQPPAPTLRVDVFGSEREDAFFVLSALVSGPTEAVLWDAQYKPSDAARLADWIAGSGKRLKAIVISHADHDHYMGALELVRRFPNTPIYMTPAGIADFQKRAARDLDAERRRPNSEAPDSLVAPQPLPAAELTVDGVALEVIDGLSGDVRDSASAAMWIPSIRTVLVGDLAFSGIHAWFGDSDYASRERWRGSLRRIAALDPVRVVPGHKRDRSLPDSPAILSTMETYLTDFDAFMRAATTPAEVVSAMTARYPDLRLPVLMAFGARANFKR